MINVNEHCTGCMACYNACPCSAISIGRNENGFFIPVVDNEKCIDCGTCEAVCPKDKSGNGYKPASAYYFKSKLPEILQTSSSGGAFHYLAKRVLDLDGVVYGCSFNSEKRTFECSSTDEVSLEELQRSKYVESNVGDAYSKIREQLDNGRQVLFCSTPCQAAGLRFFLNKQYDNLIIVDFSCGGVPSQSFFFGHVESIEKKFRSRVSGVNFRDKYYKWGKHCLTVTFENGCIYREQASFDPYFYCFLYKNTKRTSCVTCKFANEHYSDLIVADFWKYEQITDKSGDTTGISLILCQTDTGAKMMSSLIADPTADCYEIELEPACYNIKERTGTPDDVKDAVNAHNYITKHGIKKYYRHHVPFKIHLKLWIKRLLKKQ